MAEQTCASNRGLTLTIPSISAGALSGAVKLMRNASTLLEIPDSQTSDLHVGTDGAFFFKASDDKGKEVLSLKASKNPIGRYEVVLQRPNLGLMGFLCGQPATKK